MMYMNKMYQTGALATIALLTACIPTAKKDAESSTPEDASVYGRLYPERYDDLSWENDLVGFRIYGPGTQAKGETAYGYDLFFKYPDRGLVVEKLYEPETSPRTWEIVDSLREISDELADDYIASFSYHLDHGYGMDCYPVGPTLGAGVCALLDNNGKIVFPWCYSEADIIENGPDRFTAHLTFAPKEINGMKDIIEHRLISLDKGSHLNHTKVWYDNLTRPADYYIGVPRRDDSAAVIDSIAGFIAYADPSDKRPGNTAMLGLVFESPMRDYGERDGHIGAVGTVASSDTIVYNWGFTWPQSDIKDMGNWVKYLKTFAQNHKFK